MYKLILILLVLATLQACSSSKPTSNNYKVDRHEDVFSLSTTHCTYDQTFIKDYRLTDPITLIFPALPGVIYGNPIDDIVQYVRTLPNTSFLLKLPHEMGARAKTLSQKGLTIVPADTKIIRLGTFHLYEKEQKNLGGGMFIGDSKEEAYILLYVSKNSSITGDYTDSLGDKSTFNIIDAKKGWNWVSIVKDQQGVYKATLHDKPADNIKFCALVRRAFNT